MAELKAVGDYDREYFKENNMNLMYGDVNHIRYCTEMMDLPTLVEIYTEVDKIVNNSGYTGINAKAA